MRDQRNDKRERKREGGGGVGERGKTLLRGSVSSEFLDLASTRSN